MAETDGNGTGPSRSGEDTEYGAGDGQDRYKTFAGAGFGTLMVRLATGPKETPPVASTRAYLRNGLPALYQEGDFGMRFVGALESVLDPIVAILDGLPAHFDPDHAPPDVLTLMAAWLGVDLDESQAVPQQREMVRRAAELSRRRGTVGGLRLALELSFPDLPLRIEDTGGVRVKPPASEEPEPPAASFIVYCDRPVPEETQAAIARCIERFKPVHTAYRLRVKAPKKAVE
jgi:phage tail-like protein